MNVEFYKLGVGWNLGGLWYLYFFLKLGLVCSYSCNDVWVVSFCFNILDVGNVFILLEVRLFLDRWIIIYIEFRFGK